jgi:hypothetical protein
MSQLGPRPASGYDKKRLLRITFRDNRRYNKRERVNPTARSAARAVGRDFGHPAQSMPRPTSLPVFVERQPTIVVSEEVEESLVVTGIEIEQPGNDAVVAT